MADFTNSKAGPTLLPASATDSQFDRTDPLLTAQQLKDRFLFGIKLKSAETGQVLSDDLIDQFIRDAVMEAEAELKMNIMPTKIDEGYPFDRALYQMMGHLQVRQRPVTSVESLRVVTSNEQELWIVSNDWIDTRYLHLGMINIVPINVAAAPSTGSGGGAGGAAFLAILGQQAWVPAFWKISYTTGFKDGKMPGIINQVIGCIASTNILIELAAANARQGSKSLGMDGLSQSSSNPGPQLYDSKIEQLEKRKTKLVKRIRTHFGTSMFVGEI